MRGILERSVIPLIIVTGGTSEAVFTRPITWLALFTITMVTILVVAKWND